MKVSPPRLLTSSPAAAATLAELSAAAPPLPNKPSSPTLHCSVACELAPVSISRRGTGRRQSHTLFSLSVTPDSSWSYVGSSKKERTKLSLFSRLFKASCLKNQTPIVLKSEPANAEAKTDSLISPDCVINALIRSFCTSCCWD